MKEFFSNPWASGIIAGLIAISFVLYHSGQLEDRVSHNETALAEVKQEVRDLSNSHHELVVEISKLSIELHYVREDVAEVNGKLDKLLNGSAK